MKRDTNEDFDDTSVSYRYCGKEIRVCEKCGEKLKIFKKHKCNGDLK